MKKLLQNKKIQLLTAIIIALILLILPNIIRYLKYGKIILPGNMLYYDLTIATNSNYINGSYIFDIFNSFLSFFLIPFNPELAILLIIIILSISSIILLYKLLESLQVSKEIIILSITFFIISPLFITSNILVNKFLFALVISLAIFYIFLQEVNKYEYLIKGIIIFMFLILLTISLIYASVLFLLLLIFQLIQKKSLNFFLFLFIFMIISTFILAFFNLIQYPEQSFVNNIFQDNIADIGALFGYGIFQLILLLFGFYKLWYKTYFKLFLFAALFLIIIAIYYTELKYLTNIFIAIIAAYTFMELLTEKWKLLFIRDLTIFLIILGILFSTLAVVTNRANDSPTLEEQTTLLFLKEYAKTNQNKTGNGLVLTSIQSAPYVQYITKLSVAINTTNRINPQSIESIAKINDLFYSRYIKKTTQIFLQLNITYIYITEDMKIKTIWKKQDEGLLFLLPNSERFKKLYETNTTELWEFLPVYSEENKINN